MIRLKENDSRQTFQNKTIQKLRLDPKQFLSGKSICGLCKTLEHIDSRMGWCPIKIKQMYRNYPSCSEFKSLLESVSK